MAEIRHGQWRNTLAEAQADVRGQTWPEGRRMSYRFEKKRFDEDEPLKYRFCLKVEDDEQGKVSGVGVE